MSVITTLKGRPAVTSSRSDIGRSGLMRSNSVEPDSGITPGLVNWRRGSKLNTMEWRSTASLHRVYPDQFGMFDKPNSDILTLTGAFWEVE